MIVARDGDHALTLVHGLGKGAMLLFIHLKSIRFGIAACGVQVGRIAIKQGVGVVVQANHIDGGPIFNLHADQALGDVVQGIPPNHRDTTPDIPARLVSLQLGQRPSDAVCASPVRVSRARM